MASLKVQPLCICSLQFLVADPRSLSAGSGISLITALTSNYALAGVVGLSGFLGVTHEDKIVSVRSFPLVNDITTLRF